MTLASFAGDACRHDHAALRFRAEPLAHRWPDRLATPLAGFTFDTVARTKHQVDSPPFRALCTGRVGWPEQVIPRSLLPGPKAAESALSQSPATTVLLLAQPGVLRCRTGCEWYGVPTMTMHAIFQRVAELVFHRLHRRAPPSNEVLRIHHQWGDLTACSMSETSSRAVRPFILPVAPPAQRADLRHAFAYWSGCWLASAVSPPGRGRWCLRGRSLALRSACEELETTHGHEFLR